MTKKEIIKQSENAIRRNLGKLDDVPYDLANTIANVYYRFFLISEDLERNAIPTMIDREVDFIDGMKSFTYELNRLQFKLEALPTLITHLRAINKVSQPNYYKLWLEVCYDILKYDINNAMKKSGIRRAIERRFKASKVKEIPRLIDLFEI